jgi:hypothetical protein
MLLSKSCRILFAAAAIGASAQVSLAGCNCSVPPSPVASFGVAATPSWQDGVPADAYGNGSYAPGGYAQGGYGMSPGSMSASAYGATQPANSADGPYGAPGGYEARVGSPVYYHDPAGGQYSVTGNPYYDHFGPGFHRSSLHGHYRFPYYNYRAPWYYPGKAVYNRDTNFAW